MDVGCGINVSKRMAMAMPMAMAMAMPIIIGISLFKEVVWYYFEENGEWKSTNSCKNDV